MENKVIFPDYIKFCDDNLKDVPYNERETAKYFIHKFMLETEELNKAGNQHG